MIAVPGCGDFLAQKIQDYVKPIRCGDNNRFCPRCQAHADDREEIRKAIQLIWKKLPITNGEILLDIEEFLLGEEVK